MTNLNNLNPEYYKEEIMVPDIHLQLHFLMKVSTMELAMVAIFGIIILISRNIHYHGLSIAYGFTSTFSLLVLFFNIPFSHLLKHQKVEIAYRRNYDETLKSANYIKFIYLMSLGHFLGTAFYYFMKVRVWNDISQFFMAIIGIFHPIGAGLAILLAVIIYRHLFKTKQFISSSQYSQRVKAYLLRGMSPWEAHSVVIREQDDAVRFGVPLKPLEGVSVKRNIQDKAEERTESVAAQMDIYKNARIKRRRGE